MSRSPDARGVRGGCSATALLVATRARKAAGACRPCPTRSGIPLPNQAAATHLVPLRAAPGWRSIDRSAGFFVCKWRSQHSSTPIAGRPTVKRPMIWTD